MTNGSLCHRSSVRQHPVFHTTIKPSSYSIISGAKIMEKPKQHTKLNQKPQMKKNMTKQQTKSSQSIPKSEQPKPPTTLAGAEALLEDIKKLVILEQKQIQQKQQLEQQPEKQQQNRQTESCCHAIEQAKKFENEIEKSTTADQTHKLQKKQIQAQSRPYRRAFPAQKMQPTGAVVAMTRLRRQPQSTWRHGSDPPPQEWDVVTSKRVGCECPCSTCVECGSCRAAGCIPDVYPYWWPNYVMVDDQNDYVGKTGAEDFVAGRPTPVSYEPIVPRPILATTSQPRHYEHVPIQVRRPEPSHRQVEYDIDSMKQEYKQQQQRKQQQPPVLQYSFTPERRRLDESASIRPFAASTSSAQPPRVHAPISRDNDVNINEEKFDIYMEQQPRSTPPHPSTPVSRHIRKSHSSNSTSRSQSYLRNPVRLSYHLAGDNRPKSARASREADQQIHNPIRSRTRHQIAADRERHRRFLEDRWQLIDVLEDDPLPDHVNRKANIDRLSQDAIIEALSSRETGSSDAIKKSILGDQENETEKKKQQLKTLQSVERSLAERMEPPRSPVIARVRAERNYPIDSIKDSAQLMHSSLPGHAEAYPATSATGIQSPLAVRLAKAERSAQELLDRTSILRDQVLRDSTAHSASSNTRAILESFRASTIQPIIDSNYPSEVPSSVTSRHLNSPRSLSSAGASLIPNTPSLSSWSSDVFRSY